MITTVILDYGGVLAYPISGNWFLPYNLFATVKVKNMIKLFFKKNRLNAALTKANEYLRANHLLFTEDEEYEQFVEFYTIFFSELSITIKPAIINKLAHNIVFDDYKVKFYDDAVSGITELKQNFKVMILSDTWPSAKRVLKNNGVLELLDGLVMSCNYHETKETPRLFEIAVKEWGVKPGECLFVDDSEDNLRIAEKAGFNPVLMKRGASEVKVEYPVIEKLDEIQEIIRQMKEKQQS